ncbi:MAG TPA: DUF402 domain-containing protein [Candidatus Caccomorpha excrementavium]|nr:DUF402 domain-containing protein [Candidatus Caccomorpha excrementavium]
MKIKTISRKGWPRIISGKEFVSGKTYDDFDGVLALFYMEQVRMPLVKMMGGHTIVIADNDYYWMQFGPRERHYWLTAMYNRKREIVQWYFDITFRNELDSPEGPRFYDLYLDVAVTGEGRYFLLDEDELLAAYRSGEFGKEVYDMAYRTAYDIIRRLSGREEELYRYTESHFRELLLEAGWK